MTTRSNRRKNAGIAAACAAAALVLSACATSDPLGQSSPDSGKPGTVPSSASAVVVGSQAYYSNEIIAAIYAQALENAGFSVKRQFNIGQRDAYMPQIQDGSITVFPEYTGNLLQFFDPQTEARSSQDVYAALQEVLPENLAVLEQSSASDQDSYTVTGAFAAEYGLESIPDLAGVSVPLVLGGPPELAERPYGPKGLAEVYGIEVGFSATGETTVEDLVAGTVNLANVYTADPRIQTDDLVVLQDPKSLFLASHVVPLANADLDDGARQVLDAVSAALTPEGLIALNVQSTVDQMSTPDIARGWLQENGLAG